MIILVFIQFSLRNCSFILFSFPFMCGNFSSVFILMNKKFCYSHTASHFGIKYCITQKMTLLQCFDAVGWAAERASSL